MNSQVIKSSFTPFGRDPEVTALFDSAGHQEAFARLKLVVQNRYLGVLSGEVGSGKSTLIRPHALTSLSI